mmetsp:Transcript_32813/g.75923  ORF Transcript_32813/g.75923 Transcript_32813/m.75923 type:complete len:323 (-) Transcript_32813:206-1174(-)
MRGGTLASSGLVLACTFGLKHNAHAEPAYRMVFSDEFDGTTLNTSTWTAADNFTHGNTELQLYVESAVAVADGVLRLTTQYDPALAASYGRPGYEYISGWVDSGIAGAHSADPTTSEFAGVGGTAGTGVADSASKFSQAFGKWEVRAKLPSYKAAEIWPAIWFMPAPEATNPPHLCWPAGGEIDLMEMWGLGQASETVSPSQSTYHYTTNGGDAPAECGSDYDMFDTYEPNQFRFDTDQDWADDFHVWTLVWNTTSINYFVDDQLYGTITATDLTPVPQTPFYAIFNTAICGESWCHIDEDPGALFPVVHEIDYIRVYELVE